MDKPKCRWSGKWTCLQFSQINCTGLWNRLFKNVVSPRGPSVTPQLVSCWWFWSCTTLCKTSPSADGSGCAAMTTCVAEASHQSQQRSWLHNSTYNRQQEQNVTMQSSLCGILKSKGLADHLEAFLWTWTTGLYFLYGRLRDIMYTDPSSSRTLTYWKDRKSAIKRNNVTTSANIHLFTIYIISTPSLFSQLVCTYL